MGCQTWSAGLGAKAADEVFVAGQLGRKDLDRHPPVERLVVSQVHVAHAPLAEMFGYATTLRSLTQGRGTFTLQFDHYGRVER